jgi:5-(carboxyamino)imidazole ribonucleotide synthase
MRIGIFGGGQLAQMLTQAAIGFGLETVIFERTADSPASRCASRSLVGDWADRQLLQEFAAASDVITLENEFVDARILAELERQGKTVLPGAATVELIQDKWRQKVRLHSAGIPIAAARAVESPEEILACARDLGWPLVVKKRRDGYDGYGNATVRSEAEVAAAWQKLGGGPGRLLVEAYVPFTRELAMMVVRGRDGSTAAYPLVETVQEQHICRIVRAPAAADAATATRARELAIAAVDAFNGVGIFGIEMFELEGGRILINEMAPRPHNTGHYTIEGCITSQFENHLRAVLGWPLGSTELRAPAAVMVNILGRRDGAAAADAAAAALALPGVHVHLYGKRDSRRGRKMGHVTVLGPTTEAAEAQAQAAAELIGL